MVIYLGINGTVNYKTIIQQSNNITNKQTNNDPRPIIPSSEA